MAIRQTGQWRMEGRARDVNFQDLFFVFVKSYWNTAARLLIQINAALA
jgi:hypothetical protein